MMIIEKFDHADVKWSWLSKIDVPSGPSEPESHYRQYPAHMHASSSAPLANSPIHSAPPHSIAHDFCIPKSIPYHYNQIQNWFKNKNSDLHTETYIIEKSDNIVIIVMAAFATQPPRNTNHYQHLHFANLLDPLSSLLSPFWPLQLVWSVLVQFDIDYMVLSARIAMDYKLALVGLPLWPGPVVRRALDRTISETKNRHNNDENGELSANNNIKESKNTKLQNIDADGDDGDRRSGRAHSCEQCYKIKNYFN